MAAEDVSGVVALGVAFSFVLLPIIPGAALGGLLGCASGAGLFGVWYGGALTLGMSTPASAQLLGFVMIAGIVGFFGGLLCQLLYD